MSVKRFVLVLAVVACPASWAFGAPLITSISESGTMAVGNPPVAKALDVAGVVVSSFSSPNPLPEAAGTSYGMFGSINGADEPFAFSDRHHELANPRTTASGVLTTSETNTTVRAIPWYLRGPDLNADLLPDGIEYIQIANDNRDMIDYKLDVTLSAPVTAFLFLDNRNDGVAGNLNNPNTNDPVLGPTGPLSWVLADGWTRVRSGQMPNGRGDAVGVDEGPTIAADALATARVHHDPGAGIAINQFMSIYRKDFAAGAHVGFTKANGIGGGDNYVVAVRPQMSIQIRAGDANFNGVVDNADLTIIKNNFLQTGKTYGDGDISGDGIVDLNDFRLWKGGKTVPGSGSGLEAEFDALVPEPGSLMLLVMGAISLGVASGRRR